MHIALLTGGISTERPVALRSAENMVDWITLAGHTSDVFDLPAQVDSFLSSYTMYDLAIPLFHGVYGEDGQITAFLSTLGCRYAYSSFMVHSFCIDKYRMNLFAEKIGIKIPRSFYVARGYTIHQLESPLVCYPVIVKPNRWGSSLGTVRVHSREELMRAQESIVNDDILIQECIEWREFTVGVYRDKNGYYALPIVEIVTRDGVLFDYKEKYESGGYNELFIHLEESLEAQIKEMSKLIASSIGCSWVVRMDYRYDGKDLYFLEVNTIPGFSSGSLIPKMWRNAGKTEGEFIDMLAYQNESTV